MERKEVDWKKGLSAEEIIDAFQAEFEHDIEGWFSSDICCCDNCSQVIEEMWPGVHVCTDIFERQSIDLESFYSGSFLQDDFSQDEYYKYLKHVCCPNCGTPFSKELRIYPFNFNFDIEEYEKDISQIFYGLEHCLNIEQNLFVLELKKEMQAQFDKLNPINIDFEVYRARAYKKDENYCVKDYLKYPPKEFAGEGRYNKKEEQVLYLGDSKETCYWELGKPENGIVVGKFSIGVPLKILDLTDYSNFERLRVLSYSALSCHQQSSDEKIKKHYAFNHLFVNWARKIGFDGIKYYSVQRPRQFNIVLIDPEKIWGSIIVSSIEEYSTKS